MINQYLQMKENYDDIAQDGYDMERFKGLPFPSKLFNPDDNSYISRVDEVDGKIKSLSNAVINIKRNIDNEEYSYNANAIKEIYASFKRDRPVHKFADAFAASFSQLTLMADEVGADYDDLTAKIDNLCKMSKKSFSFMDPMAQLVNEYVQIEQYMKNSTYDKDEYKIYQDEMADIISAYSKTIGTAPIYLEMSSQNIVAPQVREFNIIRDEIMFRIKEKEPSAYFNMSDFYHRDISTHSGDLATFMLGKKHEDNISSRITLTQSQKIQDYIVFDDSSVCYKKGGVYQLVQDKKEFKAIFSELEHSIIAYQLRKKPKVAQYISQLYTESGYGVKAIGDLENVLIVMDTYLNNEQVLKNMKMDLSVFENKSFEAIDDHMNGLIKKHKLQHYANNSLSNKNKHLLNDNSLKSFKLLMDSGVSKSVIQNLVGKKLSAINTPEEFETYLEKVVAHISGFTEDILLDKLKNLNIAPVYQENNAVVFEVNTFDESQKLGSPSWCIARTEYYFNDYKSEGNKQYFMYDFNRNEKDDESMIGFTIRTDGSMRTQHSKSDDYHKVDDYLQGIINKILYTEKDKYNLSQEVITQLEKEFNPKPKKNTNKVQSL